ncbi:hypothetical protein AHAS_Ahas11G0181000 [Arachis hypogaea]
MGICWIMTWEYDPAGYKDTPSVQYLIRNIKIKYKRAIDNRMTISQKRSELSSYSSEFEKLSYEKETRFLAHKK